LRKKIYYVTPPMPPGPCCHIRPQAVAPSATAKPGLAGRVRPQFLKKPGSDHRFTQKVLDSPMASASKNMRSNLGASQQKHND
jgi:hypothetical protein